MSEPRDILTIDEAAELLGVSVKTFNKVLHTENIPARKIGREWKFSRQALIDWVGSGRSQDFYDGVNGPADEAGEPRRELLPHPGPNSTHARDDSNGTTAKPRERRTAGWSIDLD
ncbi:MAG: helix-turn-helix domain-containing protein [Planctomycetes bacterium]|nr:helix-turn-helix domain-containing protein [Planctomycetota bacterium]